MASATITVNLVNDVPVLESISDKAVDTQQPLTFTVLASDLNDQPANRLTLSASGLPTGALFDPATGEFSWTPSSAQAGAYSVTFMVTDDGTPNLTDSEMITIAVAASGGPVETSLDRTQWHDYDGTGTSGLARIAVTLDEAISSAVKAAFDQYQLHLATGHAGDVFEIPALKVRLVNFASFDRLLHYGTFSGVYDNPLVGTYYSETLTGTSGRDLVVGRGGNDMLYGGNGDDILVGGTGNDIFNGDAGDDVVLFSGNANGYDRFNGGAGTDRVIATALQTVIGVDGYANGVESIAGQGDTIIRDSYYSRTLDFSQTELTGIAEVDAAAGNDTLVASNLSAGVYRGGSGNDILRAGAQDVVWLYAGADNGCDSFQSNGPSHVVARAETAGTIIGLDGYVNGVDAFEGVAVDNVATTILRDTYYSRTLDFSQTQFTNIAEVDAGAGNDTLLASDLSAGRYRGGSGNDILRAGAQDAVWLYAGNDNGYDSLQNNGLAQVVARVETTGTVIGLDGYVNGVDVFEGVAVDNVANTILRDTYYSRTLDFSQTQFNNIAEVDAGAGNDTIFASHLSPGAYRGGSGNDVLHAGAQDVTWLYSGADNGYDVFLDNGLSNVTARVESTGSVIGVDGYNNGVDLFLGAGDTVIADTYYSRLLDFSQTGFVGISLVATGGGNDTIIAPAQGSGEVGWGGSGDDTLNANGSDIVWRYMGTENGYDMFLGNGGNEAVACTDVTGTVIGVNGYANGVDEFRGVGDTVIRDIYYSRVLDFSETRLVGIALIDAADGNDTVVASNVSSGRYAGGAGNDVLTAGGTADTVWVYNGSQNGFDTLQRDFSGIFGPVNRVTAEAGSAGTVIGLNGYDNAVDAFEGYAGGDTIIKDTYYSRTLDFSRTVLNNIAEIDAAEGNDTLVASNVSSGNYRGGAGADHFVVTADAPTADAVDIAILDFTNGVDRIDLTAFDLESATILETLAAHQEGSDVVLQLPDQAKTIRLKNFNLSDLDSGDFLL